MDNKFSTKVQKQVNGRPKTCKRIKFLEDFKNLCDLGLSKNHSKSVIYK